MIERDTQQSVFSTGNYWLTIIGAGSAAASSATRRCAKWKVRVTIVYRWVRRAGRWRRPGSFEGLFRQALEDCPNPANPCELFLNRVQIISTAAYDSSLYIGQDVYEWLSFQRGQWSKLKNAGGREIQEGRRRGGKSWRSEEQGSCRRKWQWAGQL